MNYNTILQLKLPLIKRIASTPHVAQPEVLFRKVQCNKKFLTLASILILQILCHFLTVADCNEND
jgi:hypothetical protein